jgi:hemoglobin/transferrin/lactoferrin receptor protein
VSYLPTDWSLLFANYGTAFRAPTVNELYTSGVHFRIPVGGGITNRFVPNPDLEPQRTQTFEFGAGVDFDDVAVSGDRFQLKATHFRTEGEDFIDTQVNQPTPFVDCNPFVPGNCNGTTQSVNVADASLWGNEVEASYDNRRVRVQLGLSTIDGENDATGEPLGVLTPPQVTVDTALKLPEIDSIVGWRLLAADEFDNVSDPADERDGYTVHDLYFAWTPGEGVLEGLRVDLGIDNVFDKAYSRVFTGALEPGRNFKGFVRYSLNF